jgi:outer membrane murein-binding lipoprotein Lpp
MSKVESLFTDFFNSADAVQVEECTWYYHESSVENELKSLHEQLAKANEDYKALFCAFESCQDELKKANESVEHLKQCISVYHSGIVDMFPHPSVTDGTFFVPIEKYNSMVTKLSELNSKQEQVLANNHSSCELECGAYGTYCKCQDKQLRKGQDK